MLDEATRTRLNAISERSLRDKPPPRCEILELGGGKVRYMIDKRTGVALRTEGVFDGIHPGRKRGPTITPRGGLAPGDERGHRQPVSAYDDPRLTEVPENFSSEAPSSNRGPKWDLDKRGRELAEANPDHEVKLISDDLVLPGETRPFATTYYLKFDGELTDGSLTIFNKSKPK